jgi:hypothetical protein
MERWPDENQKSVGVTLVDLHRVLGGQGRQRLAVDGGSFATAETWLRWQRSR